MITSRYVHAVLALVSEADGAGDNVQVLGRVAEGREIARLGDEAQNDLVRLGVLGRDAFDRVEHAGGEPLDSRSRIDRKPGSAQIGDRLRWSQERGLREGSLLADLHARGEEFANRRLVRVLLGELGEAGAEDAPWVEEADDRWGARLEDAPKLEEGGAAVGLLDDVVHRPQHERCVEFAVRDRGKIARVALQNGVRGETGLGQLGSYVGNVARGEVDQRDAVAAAEEFDRVPPRAAADVDDAPSWREVLVDQAQCARELETAIGPRQALPFPFDAPVVVLLHNLAHVSLLPARV